MLKNNQDMLLLTVAMLATVLVSSNVVNQSANADKDSQQTIDKFDKKCEKAQEKGSEKKAEQALEQEARHLDSPPPRACAIGDPGPR